MDIKAAVPSVVSVCVLPIRVITEGAKPNVKLQGLDDEDDPVPDLNL